jgi:hypothetical protein
MGGLGTRAAKENEVYVLLVGGVSRNWMLDLVRGRGLGFVTWWIGRRLGTAAHDNLYTRNKQGAREQSTTRSG